MTAPVPSSDAGGLPLDLDRIEARSNPVATDYSTLPRRDLEFWLAALEAEAVNARALVAAKDRELKWIAVRNGDLEAEVQQLRKRVNVCSAGTTGCIVDHEKVGGWCSDGLGSTEGVGVPLPIYERDL
jgi:hypothetical protein